MLTNFSSVTPIGKGKGGESMASNSLPPHAATVFDLGAPREGRGREWEAVLSACEKLAVLQTQKIVSLAQDGAA